MNGPEFLDFKGTTLTVTVVRLLVADLDRLRAELSRKIEANPAMFKGAPVILDIEPAGLGLDLPAAIGLAREAGVVPVAVLGGTPAQNEQAVSLGVGILTGSGARGSGRQAEPRPSRPETEPAPEPRQAPRERAYPFRRLEEEKTLVVAQPVRSGQRVYAKGRDLVLLGAVSPGAEVLADGNIHAYGPLRGRALAGASGDVATRIFARHLEAELVSIAGYYLTVDDVPASLRGKSAQVRLEGEEVKIDAL